MIYADYNAHAPLDPEVKKYLMERLGSGPWANPNSIHALGQKVLGGMEKCRDICATAVGASSSQVIFNSGSTEGINTVFHSLTSKGPIAGRDRIVISSIEHSAVHKVALAASEKGFQVDLLPVNSQGVVEVGIFEEWVAKFGHTIALVSVMAANNETGVIQPWGRIGELCRKQGIPFFSDTTQLIGKAPFSFKNSPLDYAVVSAHKFGGMTGIGMLLIRESAEFAPLILGGGQERGLRGGTQNYLGVETFAVACDSLEKKAKSWEQAGQARDQFEKELQREFPTLQVMGQGAPRLPNVSLISYPGLHGQGVQIELEKRNIFVSTSSACSDNSPQTSRVLKSMGANDDVGRGVIRVGLEMSKAKEEFPLLGQALKEIYPQLASIQFQ